MTENFEKKEKSIYTKEENETSAKEQNKTLVDIAPEENYSDETKYYPDLSPEENKILGEVNTLIAKFDSETEKIHKIGTKDERKRILELWEEHNIKTSKFINNMGGIKVVNKYVLSARLNRGSISEQDRKENEGMMKLDTPNHDIEKFLRELYELKK
jgi:hypothetical protein